MRYLLAAIGVALMAALVLVATPEAQAKEPDFVGISNCGKCHKKDSEGRQLAIWEESKHSQAFKTLGTADAKQAAQKVGVSGDPQKAEACLVCHVTGYGADDRHDRRFDIKDGVQCESCHGAGDDYNSKKTMQKITEERGPDKKGKSPTAEKTGLIFPDEDTCKTCHSAEIKYNGKTYKNPSYKEFNFKERWDEIKHPIPAS